MITLKMALLIEIKHADMDFPTLVWKIIGITEEKKILVQV